MIQMFQAFDRAPIAKFDSDDGAAHGRKIDFSMKRNGL